MNAEAQAGSGTVDVVGALHGTFPTLVNNDLMFDLTDLLGSIEATTDVNDSFVELGKMGTTDYQYYIPWMQATYIMAANKEALQYLPEGADVNALTWDELAQWGKNMMDATGSAKLGFPVAGLFHRFLEGYAFPSFTGRHGDAVPQPSSRRHDGLPARRPVARRQPGVDQLRLHERAAALRRSLGRLRPRRAPQASL